MNINLQQLEMNVNLHALQPGFLNRELYYIIATGENEFRFASWDEIPGTNEKKYYCFLAEKPLHIPAGNVDVNESYVLETRSLYPEVANAGDLAVLIDSMEHTTAKALRRFHDNEMDRIHQSLEEKYGKVEQHMVKSPEFHHVLLVLEHIELSVSDTMVYIKQKFPVTAQHYAHIQEEKTDYINPNNS